MKLLRDIFTCTFAMTLASMSVVSAQDLRTYTDKSILSSGKTVKIRVQEEGLYSFSYNELRDMGFSNPKNVHLRGYGGEMLNEDFNEDNKYVDDLVDQPIVDLGDKIAFYLRGVVGLTRTSASSINNIGISENYTSDYSYYFLHEEGTEAKRIEDADELAENDTKETTYTAIKWQKFDDINISKTGRNWYGNKFSNGESKTFSFSFTNLIAGEIGKIYSNVMSSSPATGEFNLKTDLTNKSATFDKTTNYDLGFEKIMEAEVTQPSSNSISATYKYTTSSTTGAGYIDYIIATAKCNLKGNVGYQMIPVYPYKIGYSLH